MADWSAHGEVPLPRQHDSEEDRAAEGCVVERVDNLWDKVHPDWTVYGPWPEENFKKRIHWKAI